MTHPDETQPIIVRTSNWPIYLRRVLLGLLLAGLIIAGLMAAGLIRYEHQRGFYAPAWGPDNAIYFIQRETRGVVAGIDWPLLNNPSYTWVWSDVISIRRLDPVTGQHRALRSWHDTPVAGQLIHAPPRIPFGILLAKLTTTGGLNFSVNVNVPRTADYTEAEIRRQQLLFNGRADNILHDMAEVMAVPGRGFYPAAIVTTIDNKAYDVLLHNAAFDALYPEGVSPALLQDLSHRDKRAMQERILKKRAALIEDFQQQGMERAEAIKRADTRLADEGYRVLEPQLVAIEIGAPKTDERVFEIDASMLRGDAFDDIAAAISQPGNPVPKSSSPYQSQAPVARDLNDWLRAGARSWVLQSGDQYYRMMIRH